MRRMHGCGAFALILLLAGAGLTTGCGTARPARPAVTPDAYFHRMITSGHAAFERGDTARAADLYANAWIRARQMDRPEAMGTAAYNLALCQMLLGEWDRARALLHEAERELQRVDDPGWDVRLAQAEVAFRQARFEEAWALTEVLLPNLARRRDSRERAQVHTLRALLAAREERWERLALEIEAAEQAVNRSTPFILRARLAEARGRLAQSQAHWALAGAAFDEETVYYRNAGRFADMAVALGRSADACVQAGQIEMALKRYFRLSRHYLAADAPHDALRVMQQALALMPADGDPAEEARWTRLYEEITEGVRPKKENPADAQ